MLILVTRYAFLLSVMFGDRTDFHIKNVDKNVITTAICTSTCLQKPYNHQLEEDKLLKKQPIPLLKKCYAGCLQNRTEQIGRNNLVLPKGRIATFKSQLKFNTRQNEHNFGLILLCRDEKSLSFRIDINEQHQYADKTYVRLYSRAEIIQDRFRHTLFIIQIHKTMEIDESLVYLSDDIFFSLEYLNANTTHNVTVIAVHNNNDYSIIANEQQFTTLNRGYSPRKIKGIQVLGFEIDNYNEQHLIAQITWKPSADLTCHYDMVFFSPVGKDSDLIPIEIHNPRNLYTYKLYNLTFESIYRIGIRAKNANNKAKESELFWETFKTPSCTEWYKKNYSICAPPVPTDFKVDILNVREHEYSLSINWIANVYYLPEYYTIRIVDLKSGQSYTKKLDSSAKSFFIPNIKINSVVFEVKLWACSSGGCSSITTTEFTNARIFVRENYTMMKVSALITTGVICIGIVLLITFIIFRKIVRFKRCQKISRILQELKKDVDTKSDIDFCAANNIGDAKLSENQTFLNQNRKITMANDTMEIDRKNINLYEILGEGAFGLVRRGILVRQNEDNKWTTCEIAVKMLKDYPSSEELRAFRREIEVMKSVEKHKNIVGIIGHCTRNIKKIMLLTEYCCFGNLLNFLREQWLFLHDIISPKSHEIFIAQSSKSASPNNNFESFDQWKSAPYPTCFNSEDRKPRYKKKMYILTVENLEYLQEKTTGNSFPNKSSKFQQKSKEILNAWDLLQIAQQVASGMEFLDKHKIVHRDLAARNILVCADLTVKIADFGLSRDIYQENIYKKTGNDKLPIKWMALESLTHQVYTSKSDIWSFGILMYEIVSLGGIPYPSIATNRLVQLLKAGYRMEKPKCCGQLLYNLMSSCWQANPNKRPSFKQLNKTLEELMRMEPQYQIVLKKSLTDTAYINQNNSKELYINLDN